MTLNHTQAVILQDALRLTIGEIVTGWQSDINLQLKILQASIDRPQPIADEVFVGLVSILPESVNHAAQRIRNFYKEIETLNLQAQGELVRGDISTATTNYVIMHINRLETKREFQERIKQSGGEIGEQIGLFAEAQLDFIEGEIDGRYEMKDWRLEGRLSALESKVEKVTEKLQELDDRTAESLHQIIVQARERFREQRTEMQAVRTEMQEGFVKVDQRFAGVEQQLERLTQLILEQRQPASSSQEKEPVSAYSQGHFGRSDK